MIPSRTRRPTRRGESPPHGFTLTESLLAVAIGAILLSLILGSVARVRRSSESVRCVSHLRQTARAYLAYVMEHRGNFPFNTHWHTASRDHPTTPGIKEYLGFPTDLNRSRIDTFLTCPTLQSDPRTRTRPDEPYHRTYTVNLSATTGHRRYSLRNLNAIPAPSRMLLLFDGSLPPGGTGTTRSYHVGHAYDTYPDRFQAPHNGRLNAIFLDGHVESLTIQELLAEEGLVTRWRGGRP
ncbi:MAG TPA: type II secretion system protein [Chthoniobacteraceae bacterium]|nr:type II secretion system protein [Chthoniobacteraceae bacterium]